MKLSYQAAVRTAAALSAALLLAPASGFAQATDDERAEGATIPARILQANGRQLTVFDRKGNVVRTLGERETYYDPIFSPDGTRVAVVGKNWGISVFDVATGIRTQITAVGGEGGSSPVWSPDGRYLAYIATLGSYVGVYRKASNGEGDEELLYRHSGRPVLTDWSLDGRFIGFYTANFLDASEATLYLLPIDGDGQTIEVVRSESTILGGSLSPDSRFLAYRSDETGRNEIFVRSVAVSGEEANASVGKWQVSTEGGLGMVSWRQDGRELYYLGADRGVMAVEVSTAQGFEFGRPRRLFKAPDAIPVTVTRTREAVSLDGFGNVSRDGQRVVFAVPEAPQLRQITVFDREGNMVSRVGEPGLYDRPVLSPDGSRVAVQKRDLQTGIPEIWTLDISTGEGIPVTSDSLWNSSPVWFPDSTHVAYVSFRDNYDWIYSKAWNGEGGEELLWRDAPPSLFLLDVSSDGRSLSINGGDIVLVVPLTGTDPLAREAIEFIREEFEAGYGRFSPDARFMAYTSNESGRWEVWVRSFNASSGAAPPEGKWQISEDGARGAISWRRDGQELYYLSNDTERTGLNVMVVEVSTAQGFQAGTPRILFRLPVSLRGNQFHHISVDGQRFVFAMPMSGTPAP